jgi:hypothetical protein
MGRVRVLTDAVAAPLAADFAARLASAGHSAEVLRLERYPIGDSLPLQLWNVASACDAAFVVVRSDSPNRAWVLRESALADLYPNLFVLLPSARERPDWWPAGDRRLAFLDGDLPASLVP